MTETRGFGAVFFPLGVLATFSIIVIAPLAAACWPEEGSLWNALPTLIGSGSTWKLMGSSLIIATGASLGATLLGAPAGHALRYVSPRVRGILLAGLFIPMAAPAHVMAVAWIELVGHGGLLASWIEIPFYNRAGVIFVLSSVYFPIPLFATLAASRRIPPALEEAARLHTGWIRAFLGVTVPLAATSTLAGGICVLLLTLLSFSIPSLFQVPVYTSDIYERFSATHDAAGAAAAGLCLLAFVSLIATIAVRRLHRHMGQLQHTPACMEPRQASRGAICLASTYCLALWAFTTMLPLLAVAVRALPPAACVAAWRTARGEIMCSLAVSVSVATGGIVLAFLLARIRGGMLPLLSAAAFCVSGPVLGVGLIRFWNHDGLRGMVYDGLAILVVAGMARHLVFPHLGLSIASSQLPACLEEAAAVHGVSKWRRTLCVVLPLLAPTLVLWWSLLFMLAWGELDASVLVAPPGWTPVSVRLFSLMHYGPSSMVAALSLVSTLFALGGAGGGFLAYRLLRRQVYG